MELRSQSFPFVRVETELKGSRKNQGVQYPYEKKTRIYIPAMLQY